MADTIPIQELSSTSYSNLNTLSGISAGTAMSVQNQGCGVAVRIIIQTAQPDVDATNYILIPDKLEFPAMIPAGQNAVWARSNRISENAVPVGIQEVV